jgi:hypothetical protein
MSLADLLHEVADAHPVPRPPHGLYEKAFQARRRRRLAGMGAALIATATLALPLVRPAAPARPAAPGATEVLPRHVQAAPGWTADVRSAPLDRALVAFTLTGSERTLTLVGANDRYRTYAVGPFWLLSPDGRYLINGDGTKAELLRLADGSRTIVAFGRPLAWSPDGTRAVFARFAGDPGATTAVPTDVLVVALPQATVLWQFTLPPTARPGFSITAALAPDNSAVAVQVAEDLYVYRPGGRRWKRAITGLQELAGPFAWCPQGTMITLTRPGGSASLALIDAGTGEPIRDLDGGSYLNSVGGQGDLSGQPAVVGWRDGVAQVNAGNRSLVGLPHNVLMTAADGTFRLQVASAALDWRTEEPGPPDPGPALQRYRLPIALAGAITLLGLALVLAARTWLERRSRASSRRRTGSA